MGLVVVFMAASVGGVKLVDDAQRRMILIVAGLMPIAGLLLDMLRGPASLMLLTACALFMAYAVGLITGKVPGKSA